MGSSWAEAWGLFFYCEGGYAPEREGRRGGRAGTGGQTGDAPEREVDGVRAGTGRKRMSAQGWKTKRRG